MLKGDTIRLQPWFIIRRGSWLYTVLPLLSRFSRVRFCDPIDGSPRGFLVPGILQARTLEWVAISFSKAWKWKVKVKSLSGVWLFATPWTAAYQALPSMGFSRQEYWSEVPLPSPNVLCIYRKLCLQVGSAFWLRTCLTNQYVILRYCSSKLCKWNYFYGDLPFFKIQVNHFMAQDEPFGTKIIPKCILWVRGLVPFWVLRHIAED